MAKKFETFEEAHARGLKVAQDDFNRSLRHSLNDEDSLDIKDYILGSFEAYCRAIGYMPGPEEEENFYMRSWGAAERAVCREIRDKGIQATLAGLFETGLRECVIAIGERWPGEKTAATRRRAA